jgi:hypothetical protein
VPARGANRRGHGAAFAGASGAATRAPAGARANAPANAAVVTSGGLYDLLADSIKALTADRPLPRKKDHWITTSPADPNFPNGQPVGEHYATKAQMISERYSSDHIYNAHHRRADAPKHKLHEIHRMRAVDGDPERWVVRVHPLVAERMVLASRGQITSVPRGSFVGRRGGHAKIDKRARTHEVYHNTPTFVGIGSTDAAKARRRKREKKQRDRKNIKLRQKRANVGVL